MDSRESDHEASCGVNQDTLLLFPEDTDVEDITYQPQQTSKSEEKSHPTVCTSETGASVSLRSSEGSTSQLLKPSTVGLPGKKNRNRSRRRMTKGNDPGSLRHGHFGLSASKRMGPLPAGPYQAPYPQQKFRLMSQSVHQFPAPEARRSTLHNLPSATPTTGMNRVRRRPSAIPTTSMNRVSRHPSATPTTGMNRVPRRPSAIPATSMNRISRRPSATPAAGMNRVPRRPSATLTAGMNRLPIRTSAAPGSFMNKVPARPSAVHRDERCGHVLDAIISGDLSEAWNLIRDARDHGDYISTKLLERLLEACLQCNSLNIADIAIKAFCCIGSQRQHSTTDYELLITRLLSSGLVDDAFYYYDRARLEGLRLGASVYDSLCQQVIPVPFISKLFTDQLSVNALTCPFVHRVLDQLIRDDDSDTVRCVLDILCKSGHLIRDPEILCNLLKRFTNSSQDLSMVLDTACSVGLPLSQPIALFLRSAEIRDIRALLAALVSVHAVSSGSIDASAWNNLLATCSVGRLGDTSCATQVFSMIAKLGLDLYGDVYVDFVTCMHLHELHHTVVQSLNICPVEFTFKDRLLNYLESSLVRMVLISPTVIPAAILSIFRRRIEPSLYLASWVLKQAATHGRRDLIVNVFVPLVESRTEPPTELFSLAISLLTGDSHALIALSSVLGRGAGLPPIRSPYRVSSRLSPPRAATPSMVQTPTGRSVSDGHQTLNVPCRFLQNGACANGDKCKFSHGDLTQAYGKGPASSERRLGPSFHTRPNIQHGEVSCPSKKPTRSPSSLEGPPSTKHGSMISDRSSIHLVSLSAGAGISNKNSTFARDPTDKYAASNSEHRFSTQHMFTRSEDSIPTSPLVEDILKKRASTEGSGERIAGSIHSFDLHPAARTGKVSTPYSWAHRDGYEGAGVSSSLPNPNCFGKRLPCTDRADSSSSIPEGVDPDVTPLVDLLKTVESEHYDWKWYITQMLAVPAGGDLSKQGLCQNLLGLVRCQPSVGSMVCTALISKAAEIGVGDAHTSWFVRLGLLCLLELTGCSIGSTQHTISVVDALMEFGWGIVFSTLLRNQSCYPVSPLAFYNLITRICISAGTAEFGRLESLLISTDYGHFPGSNPTLSELEERVQLLAELGSLAHRGGTSLVWSEYLNSFSLYDLPSATVFSALLVLIQSLFGGKKAEAAVQVYRIVLVVHLKGNPSAFRDLIKGLPCNCVPLEALRLIVSDACAYGAYPASITESEPLVLRMPGDITTLEVVFFIDKHLGMLRRHHVVTSVDHSYDPLRIVIESDGGTDARQVIIEALHTHLQPPLKVLSAAWSVNPKEVLIDVISLRRWFSDRGCVIYPSPLAEIARASPARLLPSQTDDPDPWTLPGEKGTCYMATVPSQSLAPAQEPEPHCALPVCDVRDEDKPSDGRPVDSNPQSRNPPCPSVGTPRRDPNIFSTASPRPFHTPPDRQMAMNVPDFHSVLWEALEKHINDSRISSEDVHNFGLMLKNALRNKSSPLIPDDIYVFVDQFFRTHRSFVWRNE